MSRASRKRYKSVRRMSRDPAMLPRRCAERRARYERLKAINAPDPILDHMRRMWHDAEYALSIAEGYYDPASELNRWVQKRLADQGTEVTARELMDDYRRSIMDSMRDVCRAHDLIQEWGFLVRFLRRAKAVSP